MLNPRFDFTAFFKFPKGAVSHTQVDEKEFENALRLRQRERHQVLVHGAGPEPQRSQSSG